MKCYSENWSVEKEGLSLLLQPAGHGDVTPSSLHSRFVAASCMGSVLPLGFNWWLDLLLTLDRNQNIGEICLRTQLFWRM